MLKQKRVLAAVLSLVLALSLLGTPPARAEERSTVAVTSETVLKGETVTLEVKLNSATEISGGSMNIRYDNSVLTLQNVEALTWDGGLVQVNKKYTEDTVRAVLAGISALPTECTLLTLTFAVSKTAKPGTYPVVLEEVTLYDTAPSAVLYQVQNGGVTVPCVKLRVQTVEAVASQAVKVQVLLEEGLYPDGGSFNIHYDASQLTAGTVVKGSALPNSTVLTANPKDGVIPVFWAGTESAGIGVLCTLTFSVKSGVSGMLPISIQDVTVYDENAAPMDVTGENGAIQIVAPTDVSPKLWVVGGVTSEGGMATVGVVMEGRGVICGGGFTLTYDAEVCELTDVEIPPEIESLAVVNSSLADGTAGGEKESPGTVRFIWAGAAPSVNSQLMLKLHFKVSTIGSELTLSNVQMLDADAAAVANVDLRHGVIRDSDTVLQLPNTSVDAAITATGTTVSAVVDVANAMQFSGGTQDVRILMGLYENGQMKLVEVDQNSIVFDENGIASILIETACTGQATLVKIFFLVNGVGSEEVQQRLIIVGSGNF